jgi:hypothetical protein
MKMLHFLKPALLTIGLMSAFCSNADAAVEPIRCVKVASPIIIDGSLSDWGNIPDTNIVESKANIVYGVENWTGPKDLSGSFRTAWDKNYFYIAAAITDDVISQKYRGADACNGDCILLFFDTDLTDINNPVYDKDDFEIMLNPGNFGNTGDILLDIPPDAYVWVPEGLSAEGIRVASKRTADGYTIEAAIPLSLLKIKPTDGFQIAIDVCPSDSDTPEPMTQTIASLSTRPWATPDIVRYRKLVFEDPLLVCMPRTNFKTDYSFSMARIGGFSVKVKNQEYAFTSQFSYPNAGWNYFSADKPDTGKLKVKTKKISATSYEAFGKSKFYDISRRIDLHDEYIEIEDSITNKSDGDIGIMIRNQFNMPADTAAEKVFLCGRDEATKKGVAIQPENPTLFIVTQNGGIGIACFDDVYRVHSSSYFLNNIGGIADNQFGLAKGASYTVKWQVYPVLSGDYYDFINSVRRVWNVNFTVDGPGGFLYPFEKPAPGRPDMLRDASAGQIKNWLTTYGIKYVMLGVPLKDKDMDTAKEECAMGSSFNHDAGKTQAVIKDMAKKIHDANVGAKCVVYMHCSISTEENADTRYKDSRNLQADGSQPVYAGAPAFATPMRLFFPTLANSYGREMFDYVDTLMDKLGTDGVFWDEMSTSSYPIMYNVPWDGHTVDIDPLAKTIKQKMTHFSLITLPWKVKVVNHILNDEKGCVCGNFAPNTMTMTNMHFVRFVETGSLDQLVKQHLYSPVGLGLYTVERGEPDSYNSIVQFLDYGCLFYKYIWAPPVKDGVLTRIYPFTPIELHAGYVIGRERIITNRSGLFGWGDNSNLKCFLFDKPLGAPVANNFKSVTRDGRTFAEVILKSGQVAIIER